MTPPGIDMAQPDALWRELLDDDRAAREEFARHLGLEVGALSRVLAKCFELPSAMQATP